jgi:hypothetical protein
MEKRDKNFIKIFLIYSIMISNTSFSQVKTKELENLLTENSILNVNRNQLFSHLNYYLNLDTLGQEFLISFKNNPFNFNENCEFLIILNNVIIQENKFKEFEVYKIKIPFNLLNKKTAPKVVFIFDNKSYIFTCGQSLKTIKSSDTKIHIVFTPTNEYETIYFVSTDNSNEY